MSGEIRTGCYVCHCGNNIAGKVDVAAVVEDARRRDGVVIARDYSFMCSGAGQALIKKDTRELGLNRIVIAACSPAMHETTFRRVGREAGINQYLVQIANIREQCAWTTTDRGEATRKALTLTGAALSRIYQQRPLFTREVAVNPDTLVVGGGIAGIEAALKLADAGHQVTLVEREPSLGGHMARFDKTFPTLDCAACILTPKMTAVGQHPGIRLLTYSEVVEFTGYVGNFRASVKKKPRYVDEKRCTGCGSCWENCPVRVKSDFDEGLGERKAIYIPFPQAVPGVPVIDKDHCLYFQRGVCRNCERGCAAGAINFEQAEGFEEIAVGAAVLATGYDYLGPEALSQYGYGRYDNVITGLEFERLCSATGPTEGEIRLKNGRLPQSVAIIHCVGSRDQNYQEYCSQVCCMYALKYAHLIHEKTDATIYELYIDMRCGGKGYEEFYKRVSEEKVNFIRGKVSEVTADRTGLMLAVADTLVGSVLHIPVDMVILCAAMKPRPDADKTARLFGISRSADGFFLERHAKLDPVATTTDGIYITGCCQGPKDIPATVAQAQAAAASVMTLLCRDHLEIEAVTAIINERNCAGCQNCRSTCPYEAIFFVAEKGVCRVNEALCKGCGACVSACPGGCVTLNNFTSAQIVAEMEGMLGELVG